MDQEVYNKKFHSGSLDRAVADQNKKYPGLMHGSDPVFTESAGVSSGCSSFFQLSKDL